MVRNIVKAIIVVAAMVGMVGVIQTSSANAVPGNNGTIKIHEQGTPSGTESNDPKVCSFNIEGFGFDAGQVGYIKFDVQGGDGPTGTPAGPYNFGPTSNAGYYATPYFSLDDGHYKATLYGKKNGHIDLNDVKAKSKVFKVECPAGSSQYTVKCEAITLTKPAIKPENASYQYYIDNVAVAVGTKTVSAGNHTITLKVNGVLVDTDVVKVEKCHEEKPEGKSQYKVYCETIDLKAPTSVEPENATYQYYIDGKAATLGMNDVSKGLHTVTLKVNGKIVDFDFVYVKECKDEQKPADVNVSVICDPLTNLFTFTIKNDGEASAEVMFNAETFTLDGGDSTTRSLAAGQSLTLKVDGVVYETDAGEKYDNKVFVSCQGQGSTGGTVTTTGGQGAATGVTSLPYTGSAGAQVASLIALVASVATAIGGYLLRNRAVSSL